MKFLMLCREPRLYSCQRLLEAAERKGCQMDILDPNRCLLKLNQNSPHFEVYYQPDISEAPYLLQDYQAVIPRFGITSTQMGCAVLQHFSSQSIPCLNNDGAFLLARDKWKSLQYLVKAGIPVPTTLLSGNEFSVNQSVQSLSAPLILKTLNGSQGVGVMLAEQAKSAVSILDALKVANIPVLLQDFIEEAQHTDIRCFVIGDQVVAAMKRSGQNGEFRANFHRGGTAEIYPLTEEMRQIAIQATQALGLDVAGVDLILSQQGPLVLEVNASPGLELIEKVSGVNIAEKMIDYLLAKISNHKTV